MNIKVKYFNNPCLMHEKMQEINKKGNVGASREGGNSLDNSINSIKKVSPKKTKLPTLNDRLSKMGSQKALDSHI